MLSDFRLCLVILNCLHFEFDFQLNNFDITLSNDISLNYVCIIFIVIVSESTLCLVERLYPRVNV